MGKALTQQALAYDVVDLANALVRHAGCCRCAAQCRASNARGSATPLPASKAAGTRAKARTAPQMRAAMLASASLQTVVARSDQRLENELSASTAPIPIANTLRKSASLCVVGAGQRSLYRACQVSALASLTNSKVCTQKNSRVWRLAA